MSRTDNEQLSHLLMKLYGNSDEAIFFFDRQGQALAINAAAKEIVDDDVYKQMMAGSTGDLQSVQRLYELRGTIDVPILLYD